MYCKHCGKQIDENSTFCNFCGKNLTSSVQGTSVDVIKNNATWESIDSIQPISAQNQGCLTNEEKAKKLVEDGIDYYEQKRYKLAIYRFKEARELSTELNNPKAEFILGECYHYGRGVEQGDYTALHWYKKALSHNYVPSRESLDLIKNLENKFKERERKRHLSDILANVVVWAILLLFVLFVIWAEEH